MVWIVVVGAAQLVMGGALIFFISQALKHLHEYKAALDAFQVILKKRDELHNQYEAARTRHNIQ